MWRQGKYDTLYPWLLYKKKENTMSSNEAPGTAKKGLFRIIFSRTGVILLMILLQIWFLVGSSLYLEGYITYVYGALTVLGVVVLIYIINSEGNPAFKMTWMLFVMAFLDLERFSISLPRYSRGLISCGTGRPL